MTESDGTELRRTMIVVVFGGLMSMLDATIVNIAIRTLSVRLHVPLPRSEERRVGKEC